jgi:transposase-like protein
VARALQHPRAANLSHIELAKYLGLPEATFRRWRRELSPSNDGDDVRTVRRNGKPYEMRVSCIGRKNQDAEASPRLKTLAELRTGLVYMKANASTEARFLVNAVMNWAFGAVGDRDCLQTLEKILSRQRTMPPETKSAIAKDRGVSDCGGEEPR